VFLREIYSGVVEAAAKVFAKNIVEEILFSYVEATAKEVIKPVSDSLGTPTDYVEKEFTKNVLGVDAVVVSEIIPKTIEKLALPDSTTLVDTPGLKSVVKETTDALSSNDESMAKSFTKYTVGENATVSGGEFISSDIEGYSETDDYVQFSENYSSIVTSLYVG
jgi:hypothetical protein